MATPIPASPRTATDAGPTRFAPPSWMPADDQRGARPRAAAWAIAALGAVLGAVPALDGLYGRTAWTVAGVAAIALLVGTVFARSGRRTPWAALAAPAFL